LPGNGRQLENLLRGPLIHAKGKIINPEDILIEGVVMKLYLKYLF